MKYQTEPGTLARKKELIGKREQLEAMINVTADDKTAAKLRSDYREVINELDTFYDDVKEGQQ